MSGYKTNYPNINTDFEAIEAAVMETERGRSFLHEYAKRNRHADTQVLLTALSRIEKSIEIRQEPSGVDQFRGDLLEMANAIARTRKEIAAVHSSDAASGPLVEASGELDSIVSETESATSDILASAEKIQETAFTMREGGADAALCDLVDEQATAIYTACSFQDLTAQRTRKVIDALGFIEKRVLAMVDIWAFAPKMDGHEADYGHLASSAARKQVMSQADVDFVLVEEPQNQELEYNPEEKTLSENFAAEPIGTLASTAEIPQIEAKATHDEVMHQYGVLSYDTDEHLFSREAAIAEQPLPAVADAKAPLRIVSSAKDVDTTLQRARSGLSLTAEEAEKALDALKAMSVEERTLMFS